ncbi:MAG: NAD-dependent epimerase/dehydratase family protein [Verrucomicrobiales bacterium]|nr:NAD-dependent epimerase/dehydratase family protein [Verrucomicrobiales bacterium]HQZ27346.1 NAD-dependent epimerase/dehydratase family protein [Verrucomicrobiales bacterium]
MKTVLVTGTAGFIAHRVTRLLLEQGVEVVGVDNLNDAYDLRIKQHRLDDLTGREGFRFFHAGLEHLDSLVPVFAAGPFDAVFNLAARAGVRYSIENPHVYLQSNAQGALNILELMQQNGCEKLVLASTSSLYAGQPMPFHEDLPVERPLSPYAASKKAAEVLSYTYHHLYGIDVSILRYFTVYGPAGRPDMAPFRFIKWIQEGTPITVFGDGKQTRDFTYVDDIARGTILAAKPLGHTVINLGGGKTPISLLDFIHLIEDRLGKKAEIIWKPMSASEMMDTAADIRKAKKLLDWEPQVDLETGLDETISWYLENLEWASKVTL